MTEKKYLRERVYRVKQKLGGLEVFLKWPLPAGKAGTPEFLSFRLAGAVDGRMRAIQVDLPGSCLPVWRDLDREGKPRKLRFRGTSGTGQLWFLELSFLGEVLRKPWEFRVYTAEGETELTLSEPIRVRVSEQTLKNLATAVAACAQACTENGER